MSTFAASILSSVFRKPEKMLPRVFYSSAQNTTYRPANFLSAGQIKSAPHIGLSIQLELNVFPRRRHHSSDFLLLRFTATVIADFWDANVYNGLRQFHQAKGFDPNSQDLVRHLGWPLYRLSGRIDVPSARDTDSGMVYASNDESEHSPTSDVDVDGEVSDPEDDNHDSIHKDCVTSECVEILNCQPADTVHDGTAALSATFIFLIYLQLVLFLFLGFSLLNDHI
ncbi:hypothetical protein MSAN_00132900 [Mycena sanguinolenta]|uniref:Uncharacterized protein n=1 Tax=Mycena sanguinolenta TaxID=230812 RepID=A0A8H6ZDU1_9AGAR|nr:hypothetical protein MSAN_00132900 [Mycena sanguinolenta]